jgi:very-short-patch-repair endonuclease/DNA-directed RNA polymerase subunit RPC12/RpoP
MATFESHPKSKFWSIRNTLKPNQVALNSHKKCWFDCGECGHPFDIQLNNINILNRWCPYCANKKLCEINRNCISCHNKSFASVEYSKNWSDLNFEEPFELFKNSVKKYWFECPKCKHSFQQNLSHITRGNYCSYCSNRLLCNETLNCINCFNKSFASIERSKNWSIKNKKKPVEVFKSSAEKFIFDCDKCGNEFPSKLCHITDGSWCPNCRYKTEDIAYDKLKEIYPSIKRQYKVEWCKDKKHLPFDLVIEERKIIIEIDGEQHWKQIAKWKTPEHNRERDMYKMKCANENGFSVIRIIQEDIYKNKYNWFNELYDNIKKITNDKRVQNIYMCKNNEYKDFEII